MKRINCIIVILLVLNSCNSGESGKSELIIFDSELELYNDYVYELGIKGLSKYDFLFIYDVYGCYDCTVIAENFIFSNCQEYNVLLIRVSGNEQDVFDFRGDVLVDNSRLFWKYPFKTHRNHLVNLRLKKIHLIDYVENRDLLCG